MSSTWLFIHFLHWPSLLYPSLYLSVGSWLFIFFSCLLLKYSSFDLYHVGPRSTGLGLCSSVGLNKILMTQRSKDWLLPHWLVFFCLQATCILSTFRMYAINHEGDWPQECEWHHGKPGCPTSRKAKPVVASLRMGDLPAAGAISRLSSVVRALYCSPFLLSLVSTNLGLQKEVGWDCVCACMFISSSGWIPALCLALVRGTSPLPSQTWECRAGATRGNPRLL